MIVEDEKRILDSLTEVLELEDWEVPEIAAITVVDEAGELPQPGAGLTPPPTPQAPVPVPVMKDEC